MPHDKNGNLLQVGDAVLIEATVTMVSTGEEYCNVTVSTVEKMFPGDYVTTITLNAKQVVLSPVLETVNGSHQPQAQ